jgi:mannose-6-phosphate isomerase-like protein (cupin superfamily)
MAYHVVRAEKDAWEDRPGEPPRAAADVTGPAALKSSRARLWRYAAGAKGRRHRNFEQEEVFVVLSGTLTMLLGEPAERVEVEAPGVVSVDPETPLQVFNAGDDELLLFIYGAPPATDQSEMLDDLEL